MDNIKVAIKVRPLIKREKDEKLPIQWAVQDNSIAPIDPEVKKRGEPFYFDHIFDTRQTNEDIFNVVAKPVIDAVVNGINGTIFAYGQTSSGKTFTMMGEKDSPGVIPLSVHYIFDTIANIYDREFLLRVSYIEIYNEKINDLLDKNRRDLKIKEEKLGQAIVACKEEVSNCAEAVMAIMRKGEKNRRIGETNMNERSSRGHTIFRITIESGASNGDSNGAVQVSQLNLVDLAGSERSKQTGATGDRFNEGRHINLSLSALGLVIMQLSESQDNPPRFVNFRDSKLTRILQASLGGNAMTTIICAVTPAALEETQCTLAFASRAKCIKNKPQVNETVSDAVLLKRYAKQLAKLKNELEKAKGANLVEMESKLIEKESKLIEKDRVNQLLEERIELLKTRIVSGNTTPEDERSRRLSKRRRTWAGSFQMKMLPFEIKPGLPTINELDKTPEKKIKPEQIKRRQSIIQSIDLTNQKFQTAFTDFELELIETERARERMSDGSAGGDDKFFTTRWMPRNVQFEDEVAIMGEEPTSPETTPEKKTSDPTSPETPRVVLRNRISFLVEQYNALTKDHQSLAEFTSLEKQMFVEEAVEAARVEHKKRVEELQRELANSEQTRQEILEKYTKLQSHSLQSDNRLADLELQLTESANSLIALRNEKQILLHELNKLKTSRTVTEEKVSNSNTVEKETSSIFANDTYFNEMNDSDTQCNSILTSDTQNMEGISCCDTSVENNTTIGKFEDSKKSKDITNATYSEFMREIGEKSGDELARVMQDLLNSKVSLEEENIKLEFTLKQKVRESDDVKNDIRELKSGIEKLQETIHLLTSENTDLTTRLTNEKEHARETEKSLQCTIAELNSSIHAIAQEKIALINTIKELEEKYKSTSANNEETTRLINEYRESIDSLTAENVELSSNLINKIEELDHLKDAKAPPGDHECAYRELTINLSERNKILENENIELSNNLMDKIEEYDCLKKAEEILRGKLLKSPLPEDSNKLVDITMNRTNLMDNEASPMVLRKDKKSDESQFSRSTVEDLLQMSFVANSPACGKNQRTNGETIDDLLQMSIIPGESLGEVKCPSDESANGWKLKAEMLREQVENLTLINEKLNDLRTTSCKQCAHLTELKDNRRMLKNEVKTLTRTLQELQTKFEREFADTEILRTKASEDLNLSVCDASFNASMNLDGGLVNVSYVEERVQSLHSELESLRTKHDKLSDLYREKCDEIEKLHDSSLRESTSASMTMDSPRLRRDDPKFGRLQTDMEKLQNDLRQFKKSIAEIGSTLQKFVHEKTSMQSEIEALRNEKQACEEKLMETEVTSVLRDRVESLEKEVASLSSKIQSYETITEELKSAKSLLEAQVQSFNIEKQVLEDKITETECSSVVPQKMESLEKEVARLGSEIQSYEIVTEELKSVISLLAAQVESLNVEKQVLEDKITETESSSETRVKLLENEVARLNSEISSCNTVKEDLENAKSSLEARVESLRAEREEEKLARMEFIAAKDEQIESLEKEVARLTAEVDNSNVVQRQLEDAKSSLETKVQLLKIEKESFEEVLTRAESFSLAEKKIQSLEKEISRLTGEIESSKATERELEDAKSWLEAKVKSLKTENEAFEEKLARSEISSVAQEKIDFLENEVSRLILEIENASAVQEQLNEAKSSLRTEVDSLKAEQTIRDEVIKELQRSLQCLDEKNSALKGTLERLDLEKKNDGFESREGSVKLLEAKLKEATDDLQKYVEINGQLDERLKQVKTVENELIAAKSNLEKKIEALLTEKTSNDASRTNLSQTLSKLQQENSTLTTISETLRSNLEDAINDLNERTKENVELKKNMEEYLRLEEESTKEKSVLTREVASLQVEITNLRDGICGLRHVIRKHDENNSSLAIELEKSNVSNESPSEKKFDEAPYKTLKEYEEMVEELKTKFQEITMELQSNTKESADMREELTKLNAAREELNEMRLALETKVENLKIEKNELHETLTNLRQTLSQLDEKNDSLNQELSAVKAEGERLVSPDTIEKSDSENYKKTIESLNIRLKELDGKLECYSTENEELKKKINQLQATSCLSPKIEKQKINALLPDDEKTISTKDENTVAVSSHEKNLQELESARESITKEIMSLKPASQSLELEEKSTSELFGYFVTTIMSKERELMKSLTDDFDRERRKLEDNKKQSEDAEKRAVVWAKELEAEIERTQQDLIRQETRNTELSEKIGKLENLLMESNHENQMLNDKMRVLEADYDTLGVDLEKTSESRQNTTVNSKQEKERFIRDNVDTREMELSSKLRLLEKEYKEKLQELTSSLEYQKTRNIDLSNNLEGVEANERQLRNIVDMRTTEVSKCNVTIERIQRELDAMTEAYNASSRDNAEKTQQIDEITNLLKSKCDKLSEYKTKLETITPDYEKLKEQANERQLRLEKYKSEIECLARENDKTISSLKDRLESKEIECLVYRKQLAELTNRNTAMQMELVEIRARCNELVITNEKLSKSMRNSTNKIRAEEEMEDLRDRNRTLERSLDGAGNRINELQDIKTRLMKDLMDLRLQYETACNENEEMKSVLSSHRSSVADTIELREKYEALLQEKNRLEMELVDKRSRFAQMETKIEMILRENEDLRTKNVELDAEMDDIVKHIHELRKENGELDDKFYASETTVTSHEAKIEELTRINQDLERRVKSCVVEIGELKCQRDKLRGANEAAAKTSQTLVNENSELRTKLSQLDRGDSLSCSDGKRSSPVIESVRIDNRRRRSRNELFNLNRPLEVFETNDETENCRCKVLKQRFVKLEQDLALKNAKIATLELKIQSEAFPHMRKCKDLEEIVASITRKNRLLKAEMKELEETRARDMSSECERCKQWRLNKRDQASQCLPVSKPLFMSGIGSGFVEGHAKITKLEKDKTTLKTLCRNRQKRIFELEGYIKELETGSNTKSLISDEKSSSANSTSSKPDAASSSREAMKENVSVIWDIQRQPSHLRRDWFN